MRAFVQLILWLTLLGSGGYVFVYLYRWEWSRAQIALGFFLAAEIAVATMLLLRKQQRQRRETEPPDRQVLDRLHEAPVDRPRFRWLPPPDRASVFIPVLLGAGVVAAGLAWLVERVAAATARGPVERGIAEDLRGIAFPRHGLVADDGELLAAGGADADPELRRLLGTRRTP